MEEYDCDGFTNPNKMFETPQKKHKPLKRESNIKREEDSKADKNSVKKFDLSESPKYKLSTGIHVSNSSSLKSKTSPQVKWAYSPTYIKHETHEDSSTRKVKNDVELKDLFEAYFGDISIKEKFEKCQKRIYQLIRKNYEIALPFPEIISALDNEDQTFTQLLMFDLNPKNSRKLVFDFKKLTIVPIFQCLGCNIQFSNAPALGGHLSKCSKKETHYKKLHQYYMDCDIVYQDLDEEIQDSSMAEESVQVQQQFITPEQQEKDREDSSLGKQQCKSPQIFNSSSDSKSIRKSPPGSQKCQFENENISFEEEKETPKNEKTLKRIRKNAFIPNKFRGQNQKIFEKFCLRNKQQKAHKENK